MAKTLRVSGLRKILLIIINKIPGNIENLSISHTSSGYTTSLAQASNKYCFHVHAGFTPCKNSGCQLCLPSKKSAVGFTCLCPEGALPMSWGSCESVFVCLAFNIKHLFKDWSVTWLFTICLISRHCQILRLPMQLPQPYTVWSLLERLL